MKTVKLCSIIMAIALLSTVLGGEAFAFHSGGVGECGGCHSMHAPKTGSSFLLVASDQSSTCLACHAAAEAAPNGIHIMTYPVPAAGSPPVEMTPAGDFAWLLKTYTYSVTGTTTTDNGQTHGHNVIALDFGITADPDFPTAPGGTFPTTSLACNSCHDPHGKYRRIGGDTVYTIAASGAPVIGSGSYNNSPIPTPTQAVGVYRLLAGIGYSQNNGGLSIIYPGVPAACAPFIFNRSEVSTQTRVAYGATSTGSGMTTWGLWCATCHPQMHSSSNVVHPVDQALGSTVTNNYNTYVSSGIMTGTAATSYLSLVPFMENTGDYTTLKAHAQNDDSFLNGPNTSSQVSCPSCHRAHASGFQQSMRWNMVGEFITLADGSGNPVWPGIDTTPGFPQFAQGRTSAEIRAAYYGRQPGVFGGFQRVLCNKCHAQD